MSEHDVRCIKECWDSKRCIKYFRGDMQTLDSMEPVAMYFEEWPTGIPVYAKEKGIQGYRISGKGKFFEGKFKEEKDIEVESEQEREMCDWCGKMFINVGSHKQHCKAKPE